MPGPIALTVERHGRPARAEAAGGGAFGTRERGLNPASTDPRTVSWGGRCKWPVARAIGRPRWGSTFRVIRRDPLIARPLRHKLAGIIDRLRFFNETSRTKRPTPLLEGRRRRTSLVMGEEASDPRRDSKCALQIQAAPCANPACRPSAYLARSRNARMSIRTPKISAYAPSHQVRTNAPISGAITRRTP